jgi:hypothetical protein
MIEVEYGTGRSSEDELQLRESDSPSTEEDHSGNGYQSRKRVDAA